MGLVSFMWPLITYPSFHFSFLLEWNWTQPSSCLHPYVRSKYFTFNLHSLGFPPSFTTYFLFQTPFSYIRSLKASCEWSVYISNQIVKISTLSLDSCANCMDPHPKFWQLPTFLEKHLGNRLGWICTFFLPICRSWCWNFLARTCWQAKW